MLVAREGDATARRLGDALTSPTPVGLLGVLVEGAQAFGQGHGLEIAVVLSFSLALLNLLPLPVLDGGQILLALLEAAWPRLERLRPAATAAGAFTLAGATLVLMVSDGLRIWGG